MSGFTNDIMNADNVNFTGANPTVGSITSNGQLLIGSAVSPNIRPGFITSLDGSVVISNGAGTIDLSSTGHDLHTSQFIVNASGTVGTGANFSTIAAAVAAAQGTGVNQVIFIMPGTYTENITISSGVNLNFYAYTPELREPNPLVNIVGKFTLSANNLNIGFYGIKFTTNADNCFLLSGTTSSITCQNCYFNATNADVISGTGTTSNFYINACSGSFASTRALYVVTNTVMVINNSFFIDATTPGTSTVSATNVYINNCWFDIPLSTSGSGALQITNCRFGTIFTPLINTTWITTAGTAGSSIYHCILYSGTATALSVGSGTTLDMVSCVVSSSNAAAIAGAGTFKYGNISFAGTSSAITATIQIPYMVSNNGVVIKTPGAYPYTTIPQDYLILVDSSSARTIAPYAGPATGQVHVIKDSVGSAGANTITITPSGKNIDGAASKTITTNYGSMTIVYNGTEWNII